MLQFAFDFIKYSFSSLIEHFYNLIYKNSENVEPNDTIYYFVLLSFGIKLIRINYFVYKKRDLELGDIAVAL